MAVIRNDKKFFLMTDLGLKNFGVAEKMQSSEIQSKLLRTHFANTNVIVFVVFY